MWLLLAWVACDGGKGPAGDTASTDSATEPTGHTGSTAATGDTGSTVELVVGPYTEWTDRVTSALRSGVPGANVREGGFFWLKHEECEAIVMATGTCHGANPASPYAFPWFPEDDDGTATIPDYQLEQHEAMIYVGHTPPESRYWSFNHHQYEQHREGEPERLTIFATVAPGMNMLEVSTASSPMAPGELRPADEVPFQDYTVVVFTANQTTAARVTEMLTPLLEQASYGPELINVHTMALADEAEVAALIAGGKDPADVFSLTMGYGEQADTFNMALRVAEPTEPAHPFLSSETINAAIFKLAFDDPPARDPFPWPEMPPEDFTGEGEHPDVRTARNAVATLVETQLIPDWLDYEVVRSTNIRQKTGASCINLLDKCGGNNDDSRYLRSEDRFYWPDVDEPYSSLFVVGVNHTFVSGWDPAAPQVTYTSITLNNFTRGFGVEARLDHDLEGSLDYWLGAAGLTLADLGPDFQLDPSQADSIYVLQFTRDCSAFGWPQPNPYCVEFDDGALGICPSDKFWTVERVYLNQTSGTAPHQTAVYEPILFGVGPSVDWSTAGIGGAWTLNPVPSPLYQGAWCAPP